MSRSKDAICNVIKKCRKYSRENTRSKTITSLVFYEGKFKVSTYARIQTNVKTGEVCAGGCIVIRGVNIYPGTNGRQNCNDPMFVARKLEYYHLNKEKINARRRALREEKKTKN